MRRKATSTNPSPSTDRHHHRRSILSIRSEGSILSIGSAYSILSIGSVGSILSIGSVGSAGSALSTGSLASAASVGSLGSALSGLSRWSLMAWRGDHEAPEEHPQLVVMADEHDLPDQTSHSQS
ncbi:MAG: hypothetical protein GX610_16890 [Rhodococcus sp.]|nr:hypothetical protein [Rhodococcus sp. (in: high G+C Gram-positive bacteria)]